MKRIHVIAVAVLLGIAAALGVVAAGRTAHVAARAQTRSADAVVAARTKQLDRFERALRRSLRDRPPVLPSVPAAGGPATRVTPRIVYRRPAPIVIVRATSHHDDGGHEAEGGGDD